MRVTTNSNDSQMLAQIQNLISLQTRLQTQVSTGQRIFQPEDDPAGMGRVLALKTEQSQITQFASNTSYALDVSQASFSGLNAIKKISDRAGELSTLGAGDLSPDALKTNATEVNQLIEQGVQLANTQLRNNYLFAGTAVDTPPFVATRDASGNITSVSYAGNTTQASVQISSTASIAPGSSGAANQELADFLNHLVQLRDALNTGVSTNVSAVQPALVTDENNLVSGLSEYGAVQLRIEISQSQQQDRLNDIDKLVSSETDVDLPTTITKLNQASVAYQAALQSTTKIMGMSLLDYLPAT
jgi:flagellar hook-associated protein 3 FlgL